MGVESFHFDFIYSVIWIRHSFVAIVVCFSEDTVLGLARFFLHDYNLLNGSMLGLVLIAVQHTISGAESNPELVIFQLDVR